MWQYDQSKYQEQYSEEKCFMDIKKGPWKQYEDRIYQEFIQEHQESFQCQFYRRSNQVFKVLSEILKNGRTAEQCKSHHQRMKQMTKNGTILQIIQYLDKKYEKKSKKVHKKHSNPNAIEKRKDNQPPTNPSKTYQGQQKQIQKHLFIKNEFITVRLTLDQIGSW